MYCKDADLKLTGAVESVSNEKPESFIAVGLPGPFIPTAPQITGNRGVIKLSILPDQQTFRFATFQVYDLTFWLLIDVCADFPYPKNSDDNPRKSVDLCVRVVRFRYVCLRRLVLET